ncbi:hypothetical protein C2G38_2057108, partial [Gigaspora rosea]
MSNKSYQETIITIEDEDGDAKDGDVKELYLSTSPVGDFVVEFVLLSSESSESSESRLWKYKFRMYNVITSKQDEYSDLKASKALSCRKPSEIDISKPKTFEFAKTQSKLITSEDKLSWSVAVSDKLYGDKPHESIVRLLAISCISKQDMTYKGSKNFNNYKNSSDSKSSNDSGFTIVFFINQDYQNNYSIEEKNLPLDNYGGKVKLFSKYKDNIERTVQNLDRFFIVILNVSGIHKYYFKNLNKSIIKQIQSLNKPKIRSFKYPKRIYHALNKNKNFGPDFNLRYIQRCLNLHYFLVDTSDEGAQYMELYDLRTNQLVNTFKRQNLNSLNLIADIPDNIAISNNNKLLAYSSGSKVKLYLIESSLEIASIKLNFGTFFDDDYFMHFFNDDENLL